MPAEIYGSYELVRRLATGGMAQIFLARPRGMEGFKGYLVVKRILPHLAENEDFVRMFLDEARIAARLNHPNIVQIYDLGAQDDSYFIAMEHLPGEDLRRVSRRAERSNLPIPIPLICRIIMEACEGLDYAHRKTDPNGRPLGIVHRDISPQNIVVTFNGGVKVVDFGIAQAVDQATVTRSGVLKGKYSYMSPEQASALPVDARSDIFALGVVLYELVTGTRLFKRANDIQTLNAVIECQVPAPSEVNTALSPDLDAILLKALAKTPERRYAQASQLKQALNGWLKANDLYASDNALAEYMQKLYADRLAQNGEPIATEEMDSATSFRARKRRKLGSSSRSQPPRNLDEHDAEATRAEEPPEFPPFPTGKHTRDGPQYQPWDDPPQSPGWNAQEATRTRFPTRVSTWRLTFTQTVWRYRVAILVVVLASLALAIGVDRYRRRAKEVPVHLASVKTGVRVASDPPGAGVWLDGLPLSEVTTPGNLPTLTPGGHVLELKKAGYLSTRVSFQVPESGEWSLPILRLESKPKSTTPTALFVSVEVESDPSNADLYVNGVGQGKTPQTFQASPRSILELRVEHEGYVPFERRLKVGDEPEQPEMIPMTPLDERAGGSGVARDRKSAPSHGRVKFITSPGTQVVCGKYRLGRTPLAEQALPPGVYQCRFTHAQLGTQVKRVVVHTGETVQVTVKF